MAEKKKAFVSEKKKKQLKEVEKLLKEYPVVGVVDMTTLPCAQLQKMRTKLKKDVKICMAKKRIMKIAMENVKKDVPGLDKLEKYLVGVPALIFAKENPFKIFKLVKKNKSSASAKAGDIAPYDLIIPAGPTPFGPGPVMGELGSFGIKCGIEGGKIAIKNEFVAAKKGEPIKEKMIGLLSKFGIKPMEIGLNIKAVFEKGEAIEASVLDIDEKKYIEDIEKAARWAFNLSVESAYIIKDNAKVLISKSFREAKALAIEQCILEKEVIDQIIAKINAQAMTLKKEFNI